MPFVDSYLEHVALAERAPRIGLSRTVYPARDLATAIAGLPDGVAHMAELLAKMGGPAGQSFEQAAAFMNVHYGTPEAVAAELRQEPTLPT